MASDPADPIDSAPRRRFLQVLGAATVYTAPTLLAVLGDSRPAAAAPPPGVGPGGSESSESSESSEGSESPGAPPGTLFAVADATLREDSPHTNEGANPLLRVGPRSNVVVMFDRVALLDAVSPGARVYLVVRIANNHNKWGQHDDRTVGAWPLRPFDGDFVEGNGSQLGQPSGAAVRATGPGATWHLPEDINCANDVANRGGGKPPWQGATTPAVRFARTAPLVVHVNQAEDVDVAFDVTDDVQMRQVYGWRLSLGNTGVPPSPGEDPPRPVVEYFSREGGAKKKPLSWGPRLVIDSGSESSGSSA